MPTEDNKKLLAKFIEEIWNQGNFENLKQYITDYYTIYHDPGDPWESKTLDIFSFQRRVSHSRLAFPDLHFTLHELVAEGDKVCVSWTLQGTQKGDIPGVAPSHKKVQVTGMTLYSFSDGKICGHWQVMDRFGMILQLKSKE